MRRTSSPCSTDPSPSSSAIRTSCYPWRRRAGSPNRLRTVGLRPWKGPATSVNLDAPERFNELLGELLERAPEETKQL